MERVYVTWSFHFFPTGIDKFNYLYDSELIQFVFNDNNRPPGYVSVPSGNVYVTRNCRRLTKESGRSVYAVYVRTLTLIYLLLF